MSYAETLLAKDERIVYRARQHWLAPLSDSLRPIVLVLGGLLLMLAEYVVRPPDPLAPIWTLVWVVLFAAGAIWIAVIILTWRSQEYSITTRRVLKVEGLLDKKAGDSALDKINDAVLQQGLLARIFGYGDLEILTGNEGDVDKYTKLARVVDFKKAMLNAKNYLEDHHTDQPVAAVAAGKRGPAREMTSDDVTNTLSKLADLRDKGAITPAEYESKKADLLGRL